MQAVKVPAQIVQTEPKVSVKEWLAVIGAAIGAFMAVLDIQITSSSLRNIQGALGASVDEGSWISTSYLIAEIITIPLTAWLSRVFSPKIYISVNAILFIGFSVLCGFSHDLPTMIACRAAQGFTGGVLIPMAFSIILTTLPPSKMPIGMAIFSITATFAPSIGPAIGGYLTDSFGWPYIFYLNLIPGVVLISMLIYALPARKMDIPLLKRHDIPGIISMAIGLSCLTYTLEEGQRKDWLGSELITRTAVISAVFLTFFVIREFTAKNPLVNLKLFARRNFSVGSVANVALGMALYGSVYLLPLYLSITQGYSAWQIGQVMIWTGLPQLFITPFVPILMSKIDPRFLLIFGLLMFAASCFLNTSMSHDYAGDQLLLSMLIRALGQPFIMVPVSALATAGLPKEDTGSASALFNMMRNLGGSCGIALASTLLTQREQFHSERIGESVSDSVLQIQQRLSGTSAYLHHAGASMWSAKQQALAVLANSVQQQAYIMAFNDAFLFVGLILTVAAFAALLLKKPVGKVHAAAE